MALTWVRDHISSFGGDPNNVTLIGEGAGAVCAGYHVVSPRSTGLFSKVVLMSGSPVSPACRDGDGVVNDGFLQGIAFWLTYCKGPSINYVRTVWEKGVGPKKM